MSDEVSIAEVIGFLRDFAPQDLEKLRSTYPTDAALFLLSTGRMCGEENMRSDGTSDPDSKQSRVSTTLGLLHVKCSAALAALDLAARLLPPVIDRLLKRSHRANNWESGGSLLALMSSGAALGTLWPTAPDPTKAQWAAALALIGSFVAFAPKILRKPFVGTADSITKLLVEAQDILARADQLRPLLRHAIAERSALELQEIQAAIMTADDLGRRARHLPLEAE